MTSPHSGCLHEGSNTRWFCSFRPRRLAGYFDLGIPTHHGRPFPHLPALDQAVLDVGILCRKRFSRGGRGAAEEQNGSIDGIGQRASQHELAAFHRPPRVFEVRRPEAAPPLGVIFDGTVEEQIMHLLFLLTLRGALDIDLPSLP